MRAAGGASPPAARRARQLTLHGRRDRVQQDRFCPVSCRKRASMGLQLTRGGEYAVRAMTYLARFPQGLVRSGLAVSQRGAHGGFALARPAADITMRDVIEAVDGPISLNQCVLW